MRKSKEFDNILNECLERLLIKGETIEQCLKSYPEQANKLEPLLKTALTAKKVSAIQPRPEFRARARYQFHSTLRELEAKRSRRFFGWQPRWVTAVAVVLILLLVGSGTVAAASNNMPDEPLYPVKLATEQVRLKLAPSDLDKAQLYAGLADKRVLEIARMANKGKPELVERTAQRLDNYLTMIASLVSTQKERAGVLMAPPPTKAPGPLGASDKTVPTKQANRRAKLKAVVASYAIQHPAALQDALNKAPESAKPALRRAIAILTADYEKALKAVGE